MDESVEVENQIPVEQMALSAVSPQTITKMKDILDALAHEDAIKIFLYAKNGITNSTEAIKALGLTQKRFYTRLKLLLDAGILEKWEHGYRYTFLGNIVYQTSRSFKGIVEHKDRFELADKLRKMKNLTSKEKQELMKLVTPTEVEGLNLDLASPVRMIEDYEELVKNVVEMIDKSEESIYIASKYRDVRVIEAMTRALRRGTKIQALTEEESLMDRFGMLRALLSPQIVSTFVKAFKDLSAVVRKISLSYSFVVLDEKWAVIEVLNPLKDTFYLGFIFQHVDVCKKLISIFNEMWEKAGEVPIL